jgi:glycine betaine/proline transport system ATP-binding protein
MEGRKQKIFVLKFSRLEGKFSSRFRYDHGDCRFRMPCSSCTSTRPGTGYVPAFRRGGRKGFRKTAEKNARARAGCRPGPFARSGRKPLAHAAASWNPKRCGMANIKRHLFIWRFNLGNDVTEPGTWEPAALPEKDDNVIDVREVWKVFGPSPRDILESELKDAPKEEILEKTGCVLGLRDINFTVRRGEFFVLMGLSGSGKSTLVRCFLRLVEPSHGQILIDGEDVCSYNAEQLRKFRRHTTAMVFQHFGLLPHYTVLDNVAYGLKVRGTSKQERYERAREAIETVGLKGWENYLPGALSGGMQQRVGLARALATGPEILLMDEPFSGLDPLIRRQMQDELVELQDKLQKTIIFVTHDLHEALKLGDRIAIMRDGMIIQLGAPEDILTAPADDYVRDFIMEASPAKVLTAGRIMEEPPVLLYDWEGPKTAQHMLISTKRDHAFVLNKNRRFLGLVTLEDLSQLSHTGMGSIKDCLRTDVAACHPDTLVEDLFPLASASPYNLPVVDEDNRFLGAIHTRAILESMIQDREAIDMGQDSESADQPASRAERQQDREQKKEETADV